MTLPPESDPRVHSLLAGLSFACVNLAGAHAAASDLGDVALAIALRRIQTDLEQLNQAQKLRFRPELRNEEA